MKSKYLLAAAFLSGVSLDASAMMHPGGLFDLTQQEDLSGIQIPSEARVIDVNANQLPQLCEQINPWNQQLSIYNCNDWRELKVLEVRGIVNLSVCYTGTGTDFSGLPSVPYLRDFTIAGDNLPMTSFAGFQKSYWLKYLCFSASKSPLATLDGLENAPNLETIVIQNAHNLSNWQALSRLKRLRILEVRSLCGDYNGILFAQSIEELRLCNASLKDFRLHIPEFNALPNLRRLEISETIGLKSLNGIEVIAPNLESLRIDERLLSTDSIVTFFENTKSNGQLKNLKTVEIEIYGRPQEEIARIETLSETLGLTDVDKDQCWITFHGN